MKILYSISLFLIINLNLYSQNLIIKGRIKCENPANNSTRGAMNVIVVPGFKPVESILTESNERAGFFRINTGVNYKELIDKDINIYIASRCENCTNLEMNKFVQHKRVFIDQRFGEGADSVIFRLGQDWKIAKKCENMELFRDQQTTWLEKIRQQPPEPIKNYKGSPLASLTSLSSLLTNLVAVVSFPRSGTHVAIRFLDSGEISYGSYQLNSSIAISANTGFNFSPVRDMSEAVLWNPSSIAFARKKSNISLVTNVKNNLKLSAYTKFGKRFAVGLGINYTRQDEFRAVEYASIPIVNTQSVKMNLNEYSFYLSSAMKLSPKISFGVSLKSIHQALSIPSKLIIPLGEPVNIYVDELIKRQSFDADISATYQVTNYLQLGINAMNIMGSQFYADAFVANQKNLNYQNQRSIGVGLCYKVWRFNVGSDILFTQDSFNDASFGVNFVPLNKWLLSGGYVLKQQSYSVALRIKHFRIAYINDNDLLINELRKPILPIFNGKIYGGFSFDF